MMNPMVAPLMKDVSSTKQYHIPCRPSILLDNKIGKEPEGGLLNKSGFHMRGLLNKVDMQDNPPLGNLMYLILPYVILPLL